MSDWRQHAACKNTPTEVFYPPGSEIAKGRPPTPDTRPDPYAWARQICDSCPTETQFHCLKDALDTGDHYGFRAGQEPRDIYVMLHGDLSNRVRECEWCGVTFTLSKYQNTRTRYCSKPCYRAVERAAVREKRRNMGGRVGAA